MSEGVSSPESQRLHGIAGDWVTTGHVVSDPPIPVAGSDVYEVLAGGYFLIHYVDVTVGSQRVQAVEMIGEPAAEAGTFLARSYDNEGNVEVMEVTVDDEGVFHFRGGADIASVAQPEDVPTAEVRSTLRIAADGKSMTALWERSEDGVAWERWMDMSFTRRS